MQDRSFRVNQMMLCEHLGMVLAGVPFDEGFTCPSTRFDRARMNLKVLGKIAGGVRRRIRRVRRKPDTGADAVAEMFARNPRVQSGIVDLLERFHVPDASANASKVCSNPGAFERELGFLVTASRLQEHITQIISEVDENKSQ